MLGLYAFYVIIMITSTLANLLLAHIVFSRSNMKKSSNNCLFANMAIADLVTTLFSMPIWSYFICVAQNWLSGLTGTILCEIAASASVLSVLASTMTLMAISIDRFIAVFFPIRRIIVTRNVKRIIISIWMVSAIIGIPCIYMYNIRQEHGRMKCLNRLDETSLALRRLYYVVVFAFIFGLPVVLMTISYIMISLRLWFRHVPGQPSYAGRRAVVRSKRKAVRLLIILLLAFVACWLPVHIAWLKAVFTSSHRKDGIAIILAHANSAINPCLVFTLNDRFRKELLKFFKCCPTPDHAASMASRETSNRCGNKSPMMSRVVNHATNCHTGTYKIREIPKAFSPVTLVGMAATLDNGANNIWEMYNGKNSSDDILEQHFSDRNRALSGPEH